MLKGKVAIITGGSRGIGKAITLKLAENGADVAILYHENEMLAKEVCIKAREMGVRAEYYKCNVGDFAQTKRIVASIKDDLGNVDILVNNAGITKDALISKMNEDHFDQVMNVNLKGTFNMIKHTYPYFIQNTKGKIINISSISGILGNVGQSNYSSSKAGVIGLTKAVAKEFARNNISCNAIAPGLIETDMTENLPEKVKAKALEMIPMKRAGNPEEIANVVLFLASNQSDFMTGEVIKVDGGRAM